MLLLGVAAGQRPAPVAHLLAPNAVEAPAHGTAAAVFTVTIDSGFHIQSNHPKLSYLIPTAISITPAGGVAAVRVNWPPTVDRKFNFAPDALAVFEGTVKIPVTLRTGGPGTQVLHGTFQYQACNDRVCRAPETVPFTLQVHIR
jgi:DsbC/DsbD-like thiol-disulfide interchange protein